LYLLAEGMVAVAAKNAKKRITAGCGATIAGLVNTVESDLPLSAVSARHSWWR
jgi:hypothetical protein